MKSRKTRTKKLADALMRRPTVVADIFKMGAEKMPVPEIVDQVNKFWPEELPQDIEVTEHYIWALFHRKAPFQNPDFYREVDEEDKRAVAARLYSTTPSFSIDDDETPYREVKKLDDGQMINVPVPKSPKHDVLHRVLSARMWYERALVEAEQMGMRRSAVESWADMSLEMIQ